MSDNHPEIGSGPSPRAAEVEPPATSFVHAGGSAESDGIVGIHEAARDLLEARERLGYAVHDRRDLWERLSLAACPQMGVTGNAILLLGFIAGVIDARSADSWYELVDVDGAAGAQTLRNVVNGNTFRVSVVQLEGTE